MCLLLTRLCLIADRIIGVVFVKGIFIGESARISETAIRSITGRPVNRRKRQVNMGLATVRDVVLYRLREKCNQCALTLPAKTINTVYNLVSIVVLHSKCRVLQLKLTAVWPDNLVIGGIDLLINRRMGAAN